MRSYPSECWDAQAKDWDSVIANPRNPHYYYYRTADFYIEDLAKGAQMLLELGCGTANCAINVVKPGQTIIVTDYSREMARKAKQNIVENKLSIGNQILPLVCDAQTLPFKGECFDVVFGRGTVLGYVEHALNLLKECSRVLKNGGAMGLDAMNYGDLVKEREKLWREKRYRGGHVVSELKGSEVIYLFNRQYDQDKRQIRERRVLKKDGKLVRLFLEHQKKGLKGPLNLRGEPDNLEEETVRREIFYANYYFEPEELKGVLGEAGFEDISIYPLGCICNITILQRERYEQLVDFIEKNRDWFCKLEKAQSDLLKMETAWHLFVRGLKG